MSSPTVRLALSNGQAERNDSLHGPPTVRLAVRAGSHRDTANLIATSGTAAPALLVSFMYLQPFDQHKAKYHYRDWAMDSGAFTAWGNGTVISLDDYIRTCQERLATDPRLVEVFALDVIGDWKASLHNVEAMWKAGLPAIPCFHYGSPEHALLTMAREYPKIALGGVARLRGPVKMRWAEQCFARVWPKRIHGFAFCSAKQVLGLPFHSVDATNWESGPCLWGNWHRYGKMSVKGSNQNLRSEIEDYLRIEAQARIRWAKEMRQLDAVADTAPSVRLALAQGSNSTAAKRLIPTLGGGAA